MQHEENYFDDLLSISRQAFDLRQAAIDLDVHDRELLKATKKLERLIWKRQCEYLGIGGEEVAA
jgi:hypothetical protein